MNYNFTDDDDHIDPTFSKTKWIWTLLNYRPEEVLYLTEYADVQFIYFGYEICPTTKTPHLQGFVQFLETVPNYP